MIKNKFNLIFSIILILLILSFIQAGNIQSNLQPQMGTSAVGGITTIFAGETKSIKVCDKENLTLLERLMCANEEIFQGKLYVFLKEIILVQENLTKELNETKKELEGTKKELETIKEKLNNLEEIVGIRNNSQSNSENQIFTGASISENIVVNNSAQTEEKQDKGFLGFFKRIFNRR